MAGCCKHLGVGILCTCNCPDRSGNNVSVNFQEDKCYSLFCNISSLYKWENIHLKVRTLRMDCISGYRKHSFTKVQASTTKHRQQRTKVRAKGIDPVWSQLCSMLHTLG